MTTLGMVGLAVVLVGIARLGYASGMAARQ